ncbi:hypothetical protein A3Q56_04865 [Intoshia linei]|uniref:Ion transport N-terminal domain-containing protein n=1 Tax=Intoshia linei TaxID=1819745 RepID=A0A177AZE1_9BILA|nr:hypothetical protein A3Q56_04865 [Intoshia linei]
MKNNLNFLQKTLDENCDIKNVKIKLYSYNFGHSIHLKNHKSVYFKNIYHVNIKTKREKLYKKKFANYIKNILHSKNDKQVKIEKNGLIKYKILIKINSKYKILKKICIITTNKRKFKNLPIKNKILKNLNTDILRVITNELINMDKKYFQYIDNNSNIKSSKNHLNDEKKSWVQVENQINFYFQKLKYKSILPRIEMINLESFKVLNIENILKIQKLYSIYNYYYMFDYFKYLNELRLKILSKYSNKINLMKNTRESLRSCSLPSIIAMNNKYNIDNVDKHYRGYFDNLNIKIKRDNTQPQTKYNSFKGNHTLKYNQYKRNTTVKKGNFGNKKEESVHLIKGKNDALICLDNYKNDTKFCDNIQSASYKRLKVFSSFYTPQMFNKRENDGRLDMQIKHNSDILSNKSPDDIYSKLKFMKLSNFIKTNCTHEKVTNMKTSQFLKGQIFSIFQPSDNKLALKLFGNKKAVHRERIRQQQTGHWIIHPCSIFR